MRAPSTIPTFHQHDRSRVTVFDLVCIFIVTTLFSAAATFVVGSALLGLP